MIKYKSQPVNTNLCGQTVLAMLLDKEIKDVCKVMKKSGKTRNSDIIKVLKENEIKHKYKRCRYFEHVPKVAIVKIGFSGDDGEDSFRRRLKEELLKIDSDKQNILRAKQAIEFIKNAQCEADVLYADKLSEEVDWFPIDELRDEWNDYYGDAEKYLP